MVILPDALTCASTSWNVVRDFGGLASVPQSLNARDGKLYLSVDGLGIISMPAAGGEPTVLTPDLAHAVWVSGANLYYTNLGGVLMQMPIEGGTPAVVLDARAPWMNPSQSASGVAVNASYFYWTLEPQAALETDSCSVPRSPTSPASRWRHSRGEATISITAMRPPSGPRAPTPSSRRRRRTASRTRSPWPGARCARSLRRFPPPARRSTRWA